VALASSATGALLGAERNLQISAESSGLAADVSIKQTTAPTATASPSSAF
jgi:hypothetical protein